MRKLFAFAVVLGLSLAYPDGVIHGQPDSPLAEERRALGYLKNTLDNVSLVYNGEMLVGLTEGDRQTIRTAHEKLMALIVREEAELAEEAAKGEQSDAGPDRAEVPTIAP